MKEELQGKLVEILTNIQAAAGKASDFAIGQLPDIAQSYIAYGRVVETTQFVLLLCGFLGLLFAALKVGYLNHQAVHLDGYSKGEWKERRIAAAVIGTLGALFTFCLLMSCLGGMVMVWLAPKVWLLKELAHMVK